MILARQAPQAYSEDVCRAVRRRLFPKGCIVLEDLSLFLGLLGFVCSIGMRLSMRQPAPRDRREPEQRLSGRAPGASAPARSARRRR
ncbi:hypothetical protein CEJ42_18255 [Herbaspirillum robiniae]|uniref:Uncharacterized protein n=1 Tax=Herbaspirillum robiniae TaxID=2014887 RepID=A0A246WNF9_9BURK|nr:hypothetical protein CEJ42_18255 [Herbaspirillum robiniae]